MESRFLATRKIIAAACMALAIFVTSYADADEKFFMQTSHHHRNKTEGERDVRYPQLTDNAVPAWEQINQRILHMIPKWFCEHYSSHLDVLAITPHFVSIISDENSFCGGAHPNHIIRGYVYDATTGNRLPVEKELRGSDYENTTLNKMDFEKYDAFQKKLSNFLAPRLRQHFDKCMKGVGDQPGNLPWDQNVVKTLIDFEFNFVLKEHAVVVIGVPAQVIDVCSFKITVPYTDIAPLIRPNSILHTWLK